MAIVARIDLACQNQWHDKTYHIAINSVGEFYQVITRYGPTGRARTAGVSHTFSLRSAAELKMLQLARAKERKGYERAPERVLESYPFEGITPNRPWRTNAQAELNAQAQQRTTQLLRAANLDHMIDAMRYTYTERLQGVNVMPPPEQVSLLARGHQRPINPFEGDVPDD